MAYSVKEVSEILFISERAVSKRCKNLNIRKKNNRYLIQELDIKTWQKEIKENHLTELQKNQYRISTEELEKAKTKHQELTKELEILRSKNAELKSQKDLELESLRIENTELKKQLTKNIPHQEKLKKAIEIITLEAMRQNITHKVFTDSEYQDLIGTISSVDFHIKQVEYLKSRVEKQDAILKELVDQTTQRNFLIAKEKGYDKD
jgi:BioD-like phosphotransacetylase family protein